MPVSARPVHHAVRPAQRLCPELGVTRTKMSSEFGVALQSGVDVAIGHGYGLTFDAKKYFVSTNAHFYAGGTEVLSTRNRLDPWVVSGGISYRF
jgi:outer membrane protein